MEYILSLREGSFCYLITLVGKLQQRNTFAFSKISSGVNPVCVCVREREREREKQVRFVSVKAERPGSEEVGGGGVDDTYVTL